MISRSLKVTGQAEVAAKLGAWKKKYERNLIIMVGAFAGRMEAKAVQDRPWTDQTNAARNSIEGSSAKVGGDIVAALAIGVEYGKYLELARGGKYRVIRPTVDQMRREFRQIPKDAYKVTKI